MIIHEPSLGPHKLWFSRFDVYWIQTNKQTEKLNLYIDVWHTKHRKFLTIV